MKGKKMANARQICVSILLVVTMLSSFMTTSCGAKHSHTMDKVVAKAVTCSEDGNVEYYKCKDCGKTFADENGYREISVSDYVKQHSGHDMITHAAAESTCSYEGNGEYYECKACGKLFSDKEGEHEISAIPLKEKTSHKLKLVEGSDSTCTTEGTEDYYECEDCGARFKTAAGEGSIFNPVPIVKKAHTMHTVAAVASDNVFKPGTRQHYECDVCHTKFLDEEGTQEATEDNLKEMIFDYKIAFTPMSNFSSKTEGADALIEQSAKDRVGNTVMPRTVITFKSGLKKDTSFTNNPNAKDVAGGGRYGGKNYFVPFEKEQDRKVELTVTNSGTDAISFRYYIDNYGDIGGIDVTVEAGETKTVSFIGNTSKASEEAGKNATTGCSHIIKLLSDVNTDTTVTINGYFYADEDSCQIAKYKSGSRKPITEFEVGDKFSVGTLNVEYANYGKTWATNRYVVVPNFATGISASDGSDDIIAIDENYIFNDFDVGTRTITVAFGKYSFTYTITVKGQGLRIAFSPRANFKRSGETENYSPQSIVPYVSNSEQAATSITFTKGLSAGTNFANSPGDGYQYNSTRNSMWKAGINYNIPLFKGEDREIELTVTNKGTSAISFRYYLENYGDIGGVDIQLAAGETKTVSFIANTMNTENTSGQASTPGCNHNIKLLSDVTEDTEVVINGYFKYGRNEIVNVSVMADNAKKTFKVGEKFTADKAVVRPQPWSSSANRTYWLRVVIPNAVAVIDAGNKTLKEGYEFTENDIGTHTVYLVLSRWNTALSYQITVVAADQE